jgi:hypothetical protein
MHFAAQLNLFDAGARALQCESLASIARRCDGVRVHLAYYWLTDLFADFWRPQLTGQAPPEREFWEDAIAAARGENPDFLLVAETYGEDVQRRLRDLGFDYVYDKDSYDCLSVGDVSGFRRITERLPLAQCVHFSENHDEPRAVAVFGDAAAANAAPAFIFTLPELRLVNHPQWEGTRSRLDVHLRRSAPEEPDSRTVDFWGALFGVLRLEALRIGVWAQLPILDSDSVLAWTWTTREQRVLVAVNFLDRSTSAHVARDIGAGSDINFRDLLAEEDRPFDAIESFSAGFLLTFSPWEVHIL